MNLHKVPYHVILFEGIGTILDVGKSKVFSVDEDAARVFMCLQNAESYDALNRALSNRIPEERLHEIVMWGASKGLVSTEYHHPNASDTPLQKPTFNPQAMFLMVTPSCNMRCGYCYSQGTPLQSSAQMSVAVAQEAVDYLAKNTDHSSYVIRFHGGEPTLHWDLVETTVEYSEELFSSLGKELSFGITTNGLDLDTRMIDFIKRHSIAVNLSIDGPEHVHDQFRLDHEGLGTHSRVLKNLVALRDTLGSLLEVNVVLPPGGRFRDLYDYFSALKVSSINPIIIQGNRESRLIWTAADAAQYVDDLRALGMNIIQEVSLGRLPVVIQTLTDFCKRAFFEYLFPSHCRGGWSEITVDAQGAIYPCYQFVGIEQFKIGDINQGPSGFKAQYLMQNVFVEHRTQCADCWARYLCGGGCWARNWWDGGQVEVTDEVFCTLHKAEIEMALILLSTALRKYEQSNDPTLLAYLVEPKISQYFQDILDEILGTGSEGV